MILTLKINIKISVKLISCAKNDAQINCYALLKKAASSWKKKKKNQEKKFFPAYFYIQGL